MSYFKQDRVTASEQPQNNMELMVDVESLGTVMGSPVVTIGACLFDPYSCDSGEALMKRSMLARVDISDAIKYSTGVEGGTLRWWFEQEDAAIKALVVGETVSMQEALIQLERFCLDRGAFMDDMFFDGISALPKANRFWAKDPDFDMRLMQHFYEHPDLGGARMPWKFWECRSVRTVQDLAWPDGERPEFDVAGGVAHDARWDAVTQAMMIQAAMHRLGQSKDQDVAFDKFE